MGTQYDMWWWGEDLNLRRLCRQIYSLLPLTTREPHHVLRLGPIHPVDHQVKGEASFSKSALKFQEPIYEASKIFRFRRYASFGTAATLLASPVRADHANAVAVGTESAIVPVIVTGRARFLGTILVGRPFRVLRFIRGRLLANRRRDVVRQLSRFTGFAAFFAAPVRPDHTDAIPVTA